MSHLQAQLDEIDMAIGVINLLLEKYQFYAEHAVNSVVEAVWQVAIIEAELMKGNLENIHDELENEQGESDEMRS